MTEDNHRVVLRPQRNEGFHCTTTGTTGTTVDTLPLHARMHKKRKNDPFTENKNDARRADLDDSIGQSAIPTDTTTTLQRTSIESSTQDLFPSSSSSMHSNPDTTNFEKQKAVVASTTTSSREKQEEKGGSNSTLHTRSTSSLHSNDDTAKMENDKSNNTFHTTSCTTDQTSSVGQDMKQASNATATALDDDEKKKKKQGESYDCHDADRTNSSGQPNGLRSSLAKRGSDVDSGVRRVSINVPSEEPENSNVPRTSVARQVSALSSRQSSTVEQRRSITGTLLRRVSLSRRTSSCSFGEEEQQPPPSPPDTVVDSREMRQMDRTVFYLRLAVLLTLVVAATVVATLTYIYVKRDETGDFQHEYHSAVVKVVEGFQNGVNTKVWAASAFSAMYTSRYGDDHNTNSSTWPNATMPHFEVQAEGQLLLCDGRALSFNPIITEKTRDSWEAHATESAFMLGADSLVNRTSPTSRIVADGIFRKMNGSIVDDPGYTPESELYPTTLVPVWQIAPIAGNERAVMFNLHSEHNRRRALDDMLTYKVPVLTAILQLVQDTVERPSSILFYPVVASFLNNNNNTTTSDVVGSISIVFSWDTVLARILPNYLKGVVCVLETNPTEQQYTFKLDGDDVLFLGEGDLHDGSYNDMEVVVVANVEGTDKELGVVDNLINYQLRCYPSKEFEEQYLTSRPIIYTIVGVMIFVFTAALFLFYDYLVEHRQSRTSRAAEQTGRIVNSLFPAAFRDRLFQQQENSTQERRPSIVTQTRPPSNGGSEPTESKHSHTGLPETNNNDNNTISFKPRQTDRLAKSMKKFLKVTSDKPDYNVGANMGSTYAEDPIADLFPETSIMFCDLVGFTSWCATQSPNQVFCLLEALFWEFDQLAQQYGVFKLGTIGDCYIAVTGVPTPMERHASTLAEFTIQCKKKVEQVRRCLPIDCHWQDLKMRFGIHSGAVTAGILRGQKSRFELFGDTINTASRMESTSMANCIQVSQETADLLRMEGMGSWLAPRQGLVRVKGKGNLSTFWLINPDDEGHGGVPDELIAACRMQQQQPQPEEETADTGRPRKRSSVLVPFTVTGSFGSLDEKDEPVDGKRIDTDDDVHSWTDPGGDTASSSPLPDDVDLEAGFS